MVALVTGAILAVVVLPLVWLRWGDRDGTGSHVDHQVAVYDTRPIPGDGNQFVPYFVAICSCGWMGTVSDHLEEADQEARLHVPGSEPAVERPLG